MLPEYLAKAVPNPAANRAPWYANTAPTYAGIFLWIAFYQQSRGFIDDTRLIPRRCHSIGLWLRFVFHQEVIKRKAAQEKTFTVLLSY